MAKQQDSQSRQDIPVFYSFRRCPYAMRARLAVFASGTPIELREILLRDKPEEMLQASPKGTVPVMVQPDGQVIDESLDVMLWALEQSDPHNWLRKDDGDFEAMMVLIDMFDTEFKHHLDRYKYANRYAGKDTSFISENAHRDHCMSMLEALAKRIEENGYLYAEQPCLADFAIMPFIRQYRIANMDYFDSHAPEKLRQWLTSMMETDLFTSVMKKFNLWKDESVEYNKRKSYEINS